MKQPGSEVIDKAALWTQMGGDVELLKEIVELFLADCPKMLSKVREAVNRNDAKGLEEAAHRLKGSVSNFVAKAAVEAALRLEEMGHARDLKDVADAFAILVGEFGRLQEELAAMGEAQ